MLRHLGTATLALAAAARACDRVTMDYGDVCRCTASACDTVEPLGAPGDGVVLYESTKGAHFLQRSELAFSDKDNGGWQHIEMNETATFQTMIGFGGAFTDAAAINLYSLSDGAQEQLLEAYYGDDGAQYTLGRIPIASCDFSTSVYSYDDTAGDYELEDFSIAMDLDQKIPMIQRALAKSSRTVNLFGSSWAPPAWMCEGNTTVPCSMPGEAGDQLHESYAAYLARFATEYEAQGVPIWGMTVANEPANPPATQRWQDLSLTAAEERDFVKLDLGPALRAAHPDLKLMIHDDQRPHLAKWTDTILGDPEAAAFVDGVGFHWYSAVDDTIPLFSKVADAAANYPDVFFLATEACEGYLPWNQGPQPGSWDRGQTYLHDILGDINAGASGWTDWNIALDMSGGPNWANNVVDAPILIDADKDEFYKQPMYYALAHVAKFVPEGSVRVEADSQGPFPLESAAFKTPDGNIVVEVLNRDATSGRTFYIDVPGKGYINAEIAASTFQTYVYASAE